MKATRFEFRFRLWISLAIVLLGFCPWIEPLGLGTRTYTWLWLGSQLSALGITPVAGIQVATALAIALSAAGAILRVWGTAFLGPATVYAREMQASGTDQLPEAGQVQAAGQVLAAGPYRYMRNPLYLGSWLMNAAIAVLMPPIGAVVALLVLAFFVFRLILGEEAYLSAQLGDPYRAYLRAVPRLIPSLRPRVPTSGEKPHWVPAMLGEITSLSVFLSFSILSWQFNAALILRAILIGFGLSLVVRAFLRQNP